MPVRNDSNLALRIEPFGQAGEVLSEAAPFADRVLLVEATGAVDELLVLSERHLRILGGRVRGKQGDHPAEFARRGALEVAVAEPLARAAGQGEPLRIDRAQAPRVEFGLEHHPHVRTLDSPHPGGVHPLELRVGAVREERLCQPVDRDPGLRVSTGRHHAPCDRQHERCRER